MYFKCNLTLQPRGELEEKINQSKHYLTKDCEVSFLTSADNTEATLKLLENADLSGNRLTF